MASAMSSSDLTEESVNAITDLFQAIKLLKQLDIKSRGINTLEDAKCKLLRFVKKNEEQEGKTHFTGGESLMNEVIQKDQENREQLAAIYESTFTYLSQLPAAQRKELENVVPDFEKQLSVKIDRIRDGQCGILVAGEVSAGKSSLLNLLLGTSLFPTSLLSCTSVLCELKHSEKKYAIAHPANRSVKHQRVLDLSESDPCDVLENVVQQKGDRALGFAWERVEIFWPFPLLKGGVYIVDSPGIGESQHMTNIVKKYISTAFAFIYVINSTNAGGLQPDRLQDLLEEFIKKSEDTSQAVFDPKSAIFVCNKWDLVPISEREAVYSHTVEKLKTCWPGVTENQVFCMATNNAIRCYEDSKYITSDYQKLLEGIQSLLPISLQCKLETHYRWLSQLLRRVDFNLRVYIANQTRTDEERRDLTEQLHHQLDKLASDAKRVRQQLHLELQMRTNSVCDELIAHLASASTRTRLLTWTPSECPDNSDWDILEDALASRIHRRIRKEVADWDMKNNIFLEIELDLIKNFQQEFELMEDQLCIVEGRMMGRGVKVLDATTMCHKPNTLHFPGGLLSTKQKVLIGLAMPFLVPLSIIAGVILFPIAGIQAFKGKVEDMKKLKIYREDKPDYMASLTDEILEEFLKRTNLTRLIQDQLQQVTKNIDTLFASIPNIIEADCIMIRKLQGDRESLETSLAENYIPQHFKCQHLLGRLNYLYVKSIRKFEIDVKDLTWDMSVPSISSGTYGDVYKAVWKTTDGESSTWMREMDVAVKIRRDQVHEMNVTEILVEEDNLRRFKHEHIVHYIGSAMRTSQTKDNTNTEEPKIQLIMVMELCDCTLLSKIIGPHSTNNPGKLGKEHPQYNKACSKMYSYITQLCMALSYLHNRNLVHRDLKPQNILLKDDKIKIADLGLTKPEHEISGTKCGSTCYTAPEVLEGHEYGTAADIFSLALIIWELWYGKLAYVEMKMLHSKSGDVDTAIRKGIRPCLVTVHEPPESLKTIIRQCWGHNYRDRPQVTRCLEFFTT